MAMDQTGETSPAGVASILHLANVSAAYGSSIFSDASNKNITTRKTTTCDIAVTLSANPPKIEESPLKSGGNPEKPKKKACPKQHQLPMFLSKTYHMIDRCDPEIATWSTTGDNFVVKNVERFAASVLPQYFKHSNFSSFARQLNFYGFRKLKAEPILTADFDARTASYVRFYHDKFQKDKPELLQHIKRATKSDQQSKDDVESLKMEISNLKDCMSSMASEYDRKIAEVSFDFSRKIASLSAEYEKSSALMQQLLANHVEQRHVPQSGPDMMQSLSQVACRTLQNSPSLRPQPALRQPPADQMLPTTGEKRKAENGPLQGNYRRRGSC